MDVNAEIAARATAVLMLMQDWLATNPGLPAAATAWEVEVARANGARAAGPPGDADRVAPGLGARARELLATDAAAAARAEAGVWPAFLVLARKLIGHLAGPGAPKAEFARLFAAPQPLPPAAWRRTLRRLLYQQPQERLALCDILSHGDDFFEPLLIQALLKDAAPWRARLDAARPPGPADRQSVVRALLADPVLLADCLDQARLAVPFTHVLGRELEEIARRRNEPGPRPDPKHDPFGPGLGPFGLAENGQLMGLALSGGGIRSATFALGAVQALAQRGWLPRLDYLSTVSGGGYLGSWLAALIQRVGSVRTAQQHLDPTLAPNPRGEENRPVRWLRDFSNYLAPEASAFSTDTWTMLTTWLRNALLNQAILVLFLSAVLLVPHLLLASWEWLGRQPAGYALGAALVLLAFTAVLAGWQQRWYDRRAAEAPPAAWWPPWLPVPGVLPVLLLAAGWCLAAYAAYDQHGPADYWAWFGRVGGVLGGWLLVVAFFGRYHLCFGGQRPSVAGAWAVIVLVSALAAAAAAAMLLAVARLLPPLVVYAPHPNRLVAGGVMVLVPALGAEVLALALTVRMTLLGHAFSDERREWWGRLGARAHLVVLGWVLLAGASLLLPDWLKQVRLPANFWPATTAAWLALVGTGVRLAQGISAPAQAGTGPRSATAGAVDGLTRAVPYVFILGLLVLLVSALGRLLPLLAPWFAAVSWLPFALPEDDYGYPGWRAQLGLVAALGGLSWLLAWRVGVNEFSLHHFYKNRLLRAYLGASRPRDERRANPFTDFDTADDLRLCHLRHCPLANADGTRPPPYYGPLPLLNTALNVTRGGELAHQDRRAESFVFSPFYAGFDFARQVPVQHPDGRDAEYGFRPTHAYAYPGPGAAPGAGSSPAAGGVRVGTAMAISGAAANPNMGYHSSPVTAFLLTLFNVRLGWWMGNPRGPAWQSANPRTGLGYLLKDLFGRASPTDDYVCLSDGGHFDNLGLYELVRRRCRYIVVCDGEEDAQLRFEGLANAIRRCRVDFGVEIDIDLAAVRERDAHGHTRAHAALGTIAYPDRRTPGLPPDPAAPDAGPGRLLYLKATLTGDEPVDVFEYARENPAFPHQSTSDQFFSEPQFESYRRLGYAAALRAFAPAPAGPLPDPAVLFEPARFPRPHPNRSPAALRVKYFRTWATNRSR